MMPSSTHESPLEMLSDESIVVSSGGSGWDPEQGLSTDRAHGDEAEVVWSGIGTDAPVEESETVAEVGAKEGYVVVVLKNVRAGRVMLRFTKHTLVDDLISELESGSTEKRIILRHNDELLIPGRLLSSYDIRCADIIYAQGASLSDVVARAVLVSAKVALQVPALIVTVASGPLGPGIAAHVVPRIHKALESASMTFLWSQTAGLSAVFIVACTAAIWFQMRNRAEFENMAERLESLMVC